MHNSSQKVVFTLMILIMGIAGSLFGAEAPAESPAVTKSAFRVLFVAHYGASGCVTLFEAIREANHPDQRPLSWCEFSGIKTDVCDEWECKTGLGFIRKQFTADNATEKGRIVGADWISQDWVIKEKPGSPQVAKHPMVTRFREFVAKAPDVVAIAVVTDDSLRTKGKTGGSRQERDQNRLAALQSYIAEIRKAGARPVVIMAPQGVILTDAPGFLPVLKEQEIMVQWAAALDSKVIVVPATLAMHNAVKDHSELGTSKGSNGFTYRHPMGGDHYLTAALMQIALDDAPIKVTPDATMINAQIAKHHYGNRAPQYTTEMLKTLETVAYETYVDFNKKVEEARRKINPKTPEKAKSDNETILKGKAP